MEAAHVIRDDLDWFLCLVCQECFLALDLDRYIGRFAVDSLGSLGGGSGLVGRRYLFVELLKSFLYLPLLSQERFACLVLLLCVV